MKVSVKALFESGGIRCIRKDEQGASHPARIAYVTGKTVNAARALAASNEIMKPGDGDPDVTYGSIVSVSRTTDGSSMGRVYNPGEMAPFYLAVTDKELCLSGASMLPLRENMVAMTRDGGTLTKDQSNALEGIQEIFEMVASAPDTDRFPCSLIAQSYLASMVDAFGEVDLPIDEDRFVRKSRADLLRARIGMLDARHPDGIASARPLRDLLATAGIEVGESGIGAEIRSPAMAQINEEAIRRIVLANEHMCREVFGAMTATPVSELSAAMIPLDSLDQLRTNKSNRRLSGEWIDQVGARARRITQGSTPGYGFEMDVFSEDGRDFLTISDNVGQKNNVAFVYSWPTAERIPVMDIEIGRVLNVSPEEAPGEEEIERLSQVLGQLEAVNLTDMDQDIERVRFD
jgi:hypothetical protein